jgi:hypothetical protein
MAYTYTINDAIRRAKAKADMRASNFFSQEDWIDAFNEAYTELYDILIESGDNYYVAEEFINITSSGGTDYDLPVDFYKVLNMDFEVNATSNIYVTMKRFMESERNNTVGNVANIPNGRVRIRYYPQPTKFTNADLATTLDGYANWEKMIVTRMAIIAMDAEESNTDRLYRQFSEYKRNITEASQERDYHQPARISDVYRVENSLYFPNLKYNLYGNQVRFLSTIHAGV